jgi:hypothetical protein
VPVEDFVSDIIESLRARPEWSSLDEPQFRKRLERLFNIEALHVAAKAVLLQFEYERRFHEARILTDARPVFGDDIKVPPKAAILTHTLRLSYHDSSEDIKEIYIAMDSIDVSVLSEVLRRAQQKETTLSAFFDSAHLRLIGRQ